MRRFAARAQIALATPWRERWASLARDLESLLGRRPAPALIRAPGARAVAHGTRWLTVREVTRETPDAVAIHFEAPAEPWSWQAGQFLTLHVVIEGERLRRAYSLCTLPPDLGGPAGPAIAVKRVSGGTVSRYLVEEARAGMRFEVRGPSGQFVLPPAASPRQLVLVGGGSGITPLVALAEAALAAGDRVSLLYGNRTAADVIFAERLERLAAARPGLTLRHVLEQPPAGWAGGVGRLDAATLVRELGALPAPDWIYACGPAPMMAAVREALPLVGIAHERLREERFQSLGQVRATALPATPQRLVVRIAGRAHETLARPGQTILEAGLAAGLPMPHSCTMGGCGACRVRLAGEVAHDQPNGLTPEEALAGYAFACIARPLGACEVEVPA